jgi:tetratricopeptide (TPR) repeat protein
MVNKAVTAWRKLLSLPLIRPEQQEVINNTHLSLGYLYYELGYYPEAIVHFRRVSPDHEAYPQALRAISWAEIKQNNYQLAIIALNELIKSYDDTEYGEEAHFLLGQCYLQMVFYDFAIKEYEYISAKYPETNNIAERIVEVQVGLREQEQMMEKLKIQLLVLESKLIDTIRLDGKQVPKYIQQEHERLARLQEQLIENIVAERQLFEEVSQNIELMHKDLERKESRRHWHAYAEYGKARALFLKGMPK